MRNTLVYALVAIVLAPSDALSSARRASGPPSSLAPDVKQRTVRVSHRHQRVRKCLVVKERNRVTCTPTFEDADSAATVTFTFRRGPVSVASAGGERVVRFPSQLGLQEQSVDLALGGWDVDWNDARALRHLQIGANSSPVVALRTISGRCDYVRGKCALNEEAVSRRIAIAEAQR